LGLGIKYRNGRGKCQISTDEVNKLMAGDPALANGVLAVDYYSWYGSAALSQYLEVHKGIEKVKP